VNISETLQEAVIGYYSGNLTQDQANQLVDWIGQNDENLLYFKQMGEIWHATANLSKKEYDISKALSNINNKIKERDMKRLPGKVLYLRFSTLIKVAASLLMIISLGIVSLLVIKKSKPVLVVSQFVETSAPKGSKSIITLSDGTAIWLNADTKLRYPVDFGTSNRTVYLEGEAYFKVAKDKNLPFQVITTELSVTALGTAFNVKAYNNEETIETTLEEGQVRLDPLGDTGKNRDINPVVLNKNQNAVYHKQSGNIAVNDDKAKILNKKSLPSTEINILPVKVITVSDTKVYTSWKDPRWVFKNERLSTLAPKLERRYDVNIVFKDSSLLNYAFTGILKEESLEQVLKAIIITAPIQYQINFKEVVLSEDKQLKKHFEVD
jgi:ferric-dicitrate binding protein FerR (iron transport regulator)